MNVCCMLVLRASIELYVTTLIHIYKNYIYIYYIPTIYISCRCICVYVCISTWSLWGLTHKVHNYINTMVQWYNDNEKEEDNGEEA